MKAYVKVRSTGTFLVESTHAWIHANRRGMSVWLFALVAGFVLLQPPRVARIGRMGEDYPPRQRPLYHSPLWVTPVPPNRYWDVYIDYGRLFLEFAAAESLVAALYLTWGRKES
jgi:hypothetical protein